MDKVVNAKEVKIAEGACVESAFLTVQDLFTHADKVELKGGWKKGGHKHWKLPFYFNDGATGKSRPLLIISGGYSKYGLGFFKGDSAGKDDDNDERTEKKSKKKKTGNKPLTIAFDVDVNPGLKGLAVVMDMIVKNHMKTQLPKIKAILCPGQSDVTSTQRKTARSPAESDTRTVRLTCYPGGTQLETEGKCVSMKDFPQDTEGEYEFICDAIGIDASLKDDVLTYGPMLYGKILRLTDEVSTVPMVMPRIQKDSWESYPDEKQLEKILKGKGKEVAKEKEKGKGVVYEKEKSKGGKRKNEEELTKEKKKKKKEDD